MRLPAWLTGDRPRPDWIIRKDFPSRLDVWRTVYTRVNATLLARVLAHPDRDWHLQNRAPLPGRPVRALPGDLASWGDA